MRNFMLWDALTGKLEFLPRKFVFTDQIPGQNLSAVGCIYLAAGEGH
jgi:hypothetical protein